MDNNSTVAGPGTAYLIARCNDFKQVFTLEKEFTTVGRISKNDVKLPFGSVSRTHATIVKTAAGYKVVDNGSRHGVVVNGLRVIEKYLQEGDKVQIGDVHLRFTFREPLAVKKDKDQEGPPSPESSLQVPAAEDRAERLQELKDRLKNLLSRQRELAEQVLEITNEIDRLEKKSGSRELPEES